MGGPRDGKKTGRFGRLKKTVESGMENAKKKISSAKEALASRFKKKSELDSGSTENQTLSKKGHEGEAVKVAEVAAEAADGTAAEGGATEQAQPKEIVVSLKKLKNKITNNNALKSGNLKEAGAELLTVITTLKKDRNLARQQLINWINKYYSDNNVKNDSAVWGLVYCLVNFVFRKDSRNAVGVKFDEDNSNLLGKVRAGAASANYTVTNKVTNLFDAAKGITNEQWGTITKTGISANKVDHAQRDTRKKFKKSKLAVSEIAHSVKKHTIGSKNLSPKAIKEFERLKNKVYAYGFCELDKEREKTDGIPIIKTCNFEQFLKELRGLKHKDFTTLKDYIEKFSLYEIITSADQSATLQGAYTSQFISDVVDLCKKINEQSNKAVNKATTNQEPKTTPERSEEIKEQSNTATSNTSETKQQPPSTKIDIPLPGKTTTTFSAESLQKAKAKTTAELLKKCYEEANTLDDIIDNINMVTDYPNIFSKIRLKLNTIRIAATNGKNDLAKLIASLSDIKGVDENALTGLQDKLRSLLGLQTEVTPKTPNIAAKTSPASTTGASQTAKTSGGLRTLGQVIKPSNLNDRQPNTQPGQPKKPPRAEQQGQTQSGVTTAADNDPASMTDSPAIAANTKLIETVTNALNNKNLTLEGAKDVFAALATEQTYEPLRALLNHVNNNVQNGSPLQHDFWTLAERTNYGPITADALIVLKQLWNTTNNLKSWKATNLYIVQQLPLITETSKNLADLTTQFEKFLLEKEVQTVGPTLKDMLRHLKSDKLAATPFWTHQQLLGSGNLIDENTYQTLTKFWEKARELAKAKTDDDDDIPPPPPEDDDDIPPPPPEEDTDNL